MNKIKIQGKTIYRRRAVNNILEVYNDDTFSFSLDWYRLASLEAQAVALKYDVDYLQVCGVIAAFSPLKNWEENKRIAELYIATGVSKHTSLCTGKARSILANVRTEAEILDILNGNKIQNFFLNIAYPELEAHVTIDRHAISICIGKSFTSGVTDKVYNFLKSCYIEAAESLDMRPSMVQSITWEKWRELKKLN